MFFISCFLKTFFIICAPSDLGLVVLFERIFFSTYFMQIILSVCLYGVKNNVRKQELRMINDIVEKNLA
jgi:hypothetical protein